MSAGALEPMRTNRLVAEKSPYLLQHARNPVDWFPWGEEAFERARAEDRPIFLSIGYATCHWCHVMERESFEDPEVAALLNENFISVKVDREERPDVDGVYMSVCQIMTGRGGWPLTVVLTPAKEPFFAGTYFPRESVPNSLGMLDLLPRLARIWKERRADACAAGASAVEAVRRAETFLAPDAAKDALGDETLRRGFEELRSRYDARHGGFGVAPKFPSPHQLLFLLRWSDRTGDPEGREMVEKTLAEMRKGGIFDQLGYGFHRYSTDARWLLPHFEKMLYDQALLAMAYTEMWQVGGDAGHRSAALEIFEYVTRDLQDPGGAFYSAEDADSEGREGAFYLWSRDEINAVLAPLGEDAARLAERAYRVEAQGNFADEATGRRTGENILHFRESPAEIAGATGRDEASVRARLNEIRRALFDKRAARVRPLLDDKILTDWNGLMIAALAKAGAAFGDEALTAAAVRAANFLLGRLRDGAGRLLHRHADGDSAIAAYAADYACLAWGLIELYGATRDPRWLGQAGKLLEELLARFWDSERPGVFNVDDGRTDLPVRQKDVYDGAMPSANAVAWYVLLRLGRLTGDPGLLERAAALQVSLAGPVGQVPSGHAMSLVALDLALGPAREVVVAGDPEGRDTRRLLGALADGYRPRTTVLFKPASGGTTDSERKRGYRSAAAVLEELAPFTRAHAPVEGKAAAYVCTEFACKRPVTEVDDMRRLLA